MGNTRCGLVYSELLELLKDDELSIDERSTKLTIHHKVRVNLDR